MRTSQSVKNNDFPPSVVDDLLETELDRERSEAGGREALTARTRGARPC
jgi:hypothetical protein